MPDLKQFKLPDVGEGLTEGEILSWHVAVGDTVVVNQTLVEVETAKAAVELPSPYAGLVTELLASEGETVDVGAVIITIDTDPNGAPAAPHDGTPQSNLSSEGSPESPADPTEGALQSDLVPAIPRDDAVPSGPKRTPVLVGYGVREGAVARRPRKAPTGPTPSKPVQPLRHGGLEVARSVEESLVEAPARAKPPVRKLAKDLGVDLRSLTPSGPDGTVTRDDVHQAAGTTGAAAPEPATSTAARAGRATTREPVKGVRKHMAEAMVRSAFTAPHVTEWVTVDVTRSVKLVERLREHRDFRDVKVSPLLLVARALVAAARRHPLVNSTFDADANEVVIHGGVNLGIAAATPRGLTVPNIKDADLLTLPDLARALDELVRTAKDGKTSPADLAGGTITITNVGVFGVDGGTPIINPGESAILCAGAITEKAWVHKGKVRPRSVMELTLSFDHRHIDGATGSKVLADVAAMLEEPGLTF